MENLPGHAPLQLLQEMEGTVEQNKIQPEQFKDRIIVMSMNNDIDWGTAGNQDIGMSNSSEVAAYVRRFTKGHRSFLGPGTEEKWNGTHIHKPNGSGNHVADLMMINLSESGHPLFRGTTAKSCYFA